MAKGPGAVQPRTLFRTSSQVAAGKLRSRGDSKRGLEPPLGCHPQTAGKGTPSPPGHRASLGAALLPLRTGPSLLKGPPNPDGSGRRRRDPESVHVAGESAPPPPQVRVRTLRTEPAGPAFLSFFFLLIIGVVLKFCTARK